VRPDLFWSKPLEAIVKKALAKKTSERYQTAASLQDDLASLLSGKQQTEQAQLNLGPLKLVKLDSSDRPSIALNDRPSVKVPSTNTQRSNLESLKKDNWLGQQVVSRQLFILCVPIVAVLAMTMSSSPFEFQAAFVSVLLLVLAYFVVADWKSEKHQRSSAESPKNDNWLKRQVASMMQPANRTKLLIGYMPVAVFSYLVLSHIHWNMIVCALLTLAAMLVYFVHRESTNHR
jgi:hypothetical protein